MMKKLLSVLLLFPVLAFGNSVSSLKSFVSSAKSGKADFVQTVTSPNGKTKTSAGTLEFSRPNRFKFIYSKPYAESMIADGQKIYIYDSGLNQVTIRSLGESLSATPAVILAGGNMEKDFVLKELPTKDGIEWVSAKPKQADSTVAELRVAFKDSELVAIEIHDSFGQVSQLRFSNLQLNISLPSEVFNFKVPAGADVINQ